MTKLNVDLGTNETDRTMDELLETIQAFDHVAASTAQKAKLVTALQVLADDTVRRHEHVRQMELRLATLTSEAELRQAMKSICLTYPGKKSALRAWLLKWL